MAVDPYAPCPCGSGKKLKFCCSDLVGEIEKIHRMIEGDQPRAALQHVEQSLAKYPRRASLLDLKATIELSLESFDVARETIDRFLAADPDNPSAHACQAMLLAITGSGHEAVASLQRALSLLDYDMPQRVFEAIGVVGRTLLTGGHIVAAQAHLWLHVGLSHDEENSKALELIVNLYQYSGLPLLVRDQLRLRDWPADAIWKEEALEATKLSDMGKWQQAAQLLDQLGGKYGAEPALVYNRAVMAGRLADDAMLAAGLHAYAQLIVPLDDAIEAEAVAQLLEPNVKETRLESVVRAYPIHDLDALIERLSADRRTQALDVDSATQEESDQPRARHAFVLLDRPLPETGVGLARGGVPSLGGVIAIFGRQTGRQERLELTTDHGSGFEQTVATLTEVAGHALGEMIDERVVGSTTPTEQALNWRWHFPIDTPPDVRRKLIADERHVAITERWPDVPRPGLGGKTPREAAGNPQLKIPLMAAVLILEQGSNNRGDGTSIAVVRDKLGLPQPESIDPSGQDAWRLPIVRVPRLEIAHLSDDALVQLYRRAILLAARSAIAVLAREVVARPTVADRISPSDAYRRLIAGEDDEQQALTLINEARNRSETAGESTAPWDLAELELHIDTGNAEQAQVVLGRIEQKHLDDPQVAAAVYRLLYETGVIPPEELLRQPAAAERAPDLVGAAAGEPSRGRIWTPDSERPEGGGKSALWTPT
jgi:tetratricopeptide (TPR) repeat protein